MQEEKIASNPEEGEQTRHVGSTDRQEAFPAGGLRYDSLFAILSTLFVCGIYLVGRATTQTNTSPGLLRPWYVFLFAGFVLLAALLLLTMLRSHRKGYRWRRALPVGYGLTLPGALLFVGGLIGTFLWQAAAGSLSSLETLVLPTTLIALLGAILLVGGPLRAAWLRFPASTVLGWAAVVPVLLSITWIVSLCMFMTQFAHPWTQATTVTDTTPTPVYSDISTMHADGTAQTRLTLNSSNGYFGPTWSPDGHKIAFALSLGSSPTNLYVMNADGTNPVRLTHISLTCYLQQWSPDGSKLVFIAQQGNDVNTAAVYVINADGSNLRRLTHEDAREYGAVWSPDGKLIAYGSFQDGTWHIYVMHADGSNVRRLTSMSGNKPTWSPDGRSIAFTSDVSGHNDLYMMNADGSHVHLLTAYGDHAAWSPDGQHIAFESNRSGSEEIYSMNRDGSGVTNLTRNPGVENQLPAWSPDSREITYMTQRQAMQLNGAMMQSLGIASIIIQAALLVGVVLLLVQRWRLPFGAFTLMISLNGLLLSVLGNQYVLIPAALLTGLVADVLFWWLHPSVKQPVRYTLLAGSVPVVWSGLYFLTLSLTQGIGWSLPLWTGAILLAGLVGLLLSFLFRLPLDTGGRP